jgi:hypothetical protein
MTKFPEGVCVVMPVYSHVNYRLQNLLLEMQVPCIQNFGTSVIAMARSVLASRCLKVPNMKRFVWLDADMVLTRENLMQLATEENPLVSGVYVSSNAEPCVGVASNTEQELPESGYIPIEWAGMGCVSMAREVLEKVCEKLPLLPLHGGIYPAFADLFFNADRQVVYPDDADAVFWFTEDLAFFWRARQAGFTPLLKCDLRVAHLKEFPLPVIPGRAIGRNGKGFGQ